jgi:hypothetical protein
MGRKNSVSTLEDVNKAISYLRRARLRSAKDVFVKPAHSEEELGKLERLLTPLKEEDASAVFGSWMELHLTQGGRVRLLGTLRRQRADAKPARPKPRTISLSTAVYGELERLSKATGGIPMPKLLESLAAIANVDKKLQEKLLKLSIALSLK